MSLSMSPESCELVHEVSFDPLYRLSQVYTLVVSVFAVFPLSYLIFFRLQKTTFNDNIKFLLTLYFILILVSVINNIVTFAHHVLIPFLATNNCDLMVNPTKNVIFQYIGVFGMSSPMLTILGISTERLIALIFAKCYENARLHIGFVIGVIAMVIDVFIVTWLFNNEKFDKPMMSYFMLPDTSGQGMNYLCGTLLIINFLSMIFNYILVRINMVLRERWRNTLSVRFQMEENILTTKFSTYISFLHVFFFMLYLVFTLIIRLLGHQFLTSEADWLSMRGIYITIPTYNLLIGFFACGVLRHLHNKKNSKVGAELAMNYGGLEGYEMHTYAILQAWNSKTL